MSLVSPPPSYVSLQGNNGSAWQQSGNRRSAPCYQTPKKKRSCCCKFFCCCCCFLFVFLLIVGGFALFIYFFFKPQAPTYNIDNFVVKNFAAEPDLSLVTNFVVSVKADNPNEKAELIYRSRSSVTVAYKETMLCSGNIPEFQQGTKNVTVVDVALNGKSPLGTEMQEALTENQKGGNIPLLVEAKVPINVVLSGIKLPKIVTNIKGSLVVDNLAPNKKVTIVSSKYDVTISLKFWE